MGKKETFEKHCELVKKLRAGTNQAELQEYQIYARIERDSLWLKDEYYSKVSKSVKDEYIHLDFDSFRQRAFGRDINWYRQMMIILSEEELYNGKEIFLKYGRIFAGHLLKENRDDISKILEIAEKKGPACRFTDIERELWPDRKKSRGIVVSIDDSYKTKYEKLKVEYEELKVEYEVYKGKIKKEFEALKETIRILSINGVKQKNFEGKE